MKLNSSNPQSWVGRKLTFTTTRNKRQVLPNLRKIVKDSDETVSFNVVEIIDQQKARDQGIKIDTTYDPKVRLVRVIDSSTGATSVFPIGYIAAGIDSGSIKLSESRSGKLIHVLDWFQK